MPTGIEMLFAEVKVCSGQLLKYSGPARVVTHMALPSCSGSEDQKWHTDQLMLPVLKTGILTSQTASQEACLEAAP